MRTNMHSHFIHILSSHKLPIDTPLGLSYSIQWTDPAQFSAVVAVVVAVVVPFVPDPALKRGETGWLLRTFKNSYFIARTFRLHTQVPNALEKHLK